MDGETTEWLEHRCALHHSSMDLHIPVYVGCRPLRSMDLQIILRALKLQAMSEGISYDIP